MSELHPSLLFLCPQGKYVLYIPFWELSICDVTRATGTSLSPANTCVMFVFLEFPLSRSLGNVNSVSSS